MITTLPERASAPAPRPGPGAGGVRAEGGFDPAYFFTLFAVFLNVGKPQEFIPHIGAARPAAAMIIAAILFSLINGKLFLSRVLFSRETLLMAAFALVALFTVPIAIWKGGALASWQKIFVPDLLMVLPVAANIDTPRRFRSLLRALIASSFVLVLGIFFAPVVEAGRVSTGQNYDANDIGLIIVCTVPLIVAEIVDGTLLRKALFGAIGAASMLALLRTQSRGALIGLAMVGLVMMVRRIERIGFVYKVLAVVAGLVLVLGFMSTAFKSRIDEAVSGEDYNMSGGGRLDLWRGALSISARFPMGVGIGQAPVAMGTYERSRNVGWHTTHNALLQVLVELGPLGVILWVAIVWTIWVNCRIALTTLRARAPDDPLITFVASTQVALLGYLVCAMFLSLAYLVVIPILLWGTGALRVALGEPKLAAEPTKRQKVRVAGRDETARDGSRSPWPDSPRRSTTPERD